MFKHTLELESLKTRELFDVLDDGSDYTFIDEFVHSAVGVKGSARRILRRRWGGHGAFEKGLKGNGFDWSRSIGECMMRSRPSLEARLDARHAWAAVGVRSYRSQQNPGSALNLGTRFCDILRI